MKQIKTLLIAALCGVCGGLFAQTPENLYIIGGPFKGYCPGGDLNWRKLDCVQLERDAENPAVFYFRGFMAYNKTVTRNGKAVSLPGSFKFIDSTAEGSWNGFHPGAADLTLTTEMIGQEQTMVPTSGNPDTKWVLPEDGSMDGKYEIVLDTEKKTFTLKSFDHVDLYIPVGLYFVGGPWIDTDYAWSGPDNVIKMVRDSENQNTFHYRGYIESNQWGNERGAFKILVNTNTWDDQIMPDNAVDLLSLYESKGEAAITRRGGQPDNKFSIPEADPAAPATAIPAGNGYWDFTLTINNEGKGTFKVNNFIPELEYHQELYLWGAAFAGWEADKKQAMTRTETGKYTWTGVINAGEFKLPRMTDPFAGTYVATPGNITVALDQAYPLAYEKNYAHDAENHDEGQIDENKRTDAKFVVPEDLAGKEVTVSVDLNAMTLTLAEAAENPGTGIDGIEAQLATVYVQGGQLFIDGVAGTDYTASVYSLDGREVSRAAFTGNAEIALPQGSYVVTLANPATGRTSTTKVVL